MNNAAPIYPIDQGTFTWYLQPYQYQGNLWIKWATNAPFRAQQGQIHVYKGNFPSDPTKDTKTWSWDNDNNGNWNTGLPWGTGWNCAYIAEASPNGPYAYLVQVVTAQTMGPNVTKEAALASAAA